MTMLKKNLWKLLISTLIILLPILFGLIFWNELPLQMITHWGANGQADGSSSRAFAVFGLPLVILAIHWVCVFFTSKDPGNQEQNQKLFSLVLWVTPIISLLSSGMIYAEAFGWDVQPLFLMPLLMGALFLAIGNYLPKCRQNRTIGIKIKWTLENEQNWNATHRFGGKVWAIGGLALMACTPLPETLLVWAMAVILCVLIIIPMVYSYVYHRKQLKSGTATITPPTKTKAGRLGAACAVVILLLVAVLMFTGDITVHFGEESFFIEASYWNDLMVEYEVIESAEYRESDSWGIRTFGLGSARLLAGSFSNDEFGSYTRYSYTGCKSCVVMQADGKTLVLNGPDIESTKALYETIQGHLN